MEAIHQRLRVGNMVVMGLQHRHLLLSGVAGQHRDDIDIPPASVTFVETVCLQEPDI